MVLFFFVDKEESSTLCEDNDGDFSASESEYDPEDEDAPTSSSSESEEELDDEDVQLVRASEPKKPHTAVFSDPSSPKHVLSEVNQSPAEKASFSDEQPAPTISPNNESGKKKYYCLFCETLVTEFSHHLKRKHEDKMDVIEITSTEDKKRRLQLIERLRNRGSYIYNLSLNDENQHKAILKRKQKNVTQEDFVTCDKCLGNYKKNCLYRHRCRFASPSSKPSVKRARHMENINFENNAKMYNYILPSMQQGEVRLAVKTDPLIMRFGETLSTKIDSKSESHKINDISQRLRDLAKLLLFLRQKYPFIKILSDCLRGSMYPKVVEAVKHVSKRFCKKRKI